MINSTVQSLSPNVCSVWNWIYMVFILAVHLQANYKRWQLSAEKALWCTLIKWFPPLAHQKKLQGRHEPPSFQCIKFKSYVPSIWGAHKTLFGSLELARHSTFPVNLNTLITWIRISCLACLDESRIHFLIIYDKEQNIWPLFGWLELGCLLHSTHLTLPVNLPYL